jgi:hypothetical protein
MQRVTFNYAPTVNKIFDEAFAERGLKPLDSWHLFEIAVDPRYVIASAVRQHT